ncbi:MAG: FAD-binding oxidoreductase [Chloroflexi bacterium]|nr:FAD-binding oxidoreductase [Chloroflexota bacterium]
MTNANDMNVSTIVIVGGGVIGLSSAYHLARRGVPRVVLLEKDTVGAGASSRAGGIITAQLWSKTGIEARKLSLRLFQEISEELRPYGYRFQAVGCLNLFSPADWCEREKLLPLYRECGLPYETLAAAEIRQRWPLLAPADDIIGLFDPLGGYSEPDDYIPALAQHCRALGVDIREGVTVTDFVVERGRVMGIRADGEFLAADQVICCAHSWTNRLLAAVGLQLPMKSFVHQRYLTAPLAKTPALPAVNANPAGVYLRPAKGERLLVGGETANRLEQENPAYGFGMDDLRAPAGFSARLRGKAQALLPALAQAPFQVERVGLIAFSMDGEPILGAVSGVSGLLLGTAFHSGGFAYNPVAGKLLADLATEGETTLDITAFSPDRFKPAEASVYRKSRLRQNQAFSRRH